MPHSLRRIFSLVLLLMASVILSGCETPAPKIVTEYVIKEVYVLPPDAMLVNCVASEPFFIDDYLNADEEERERMSFTYINSLISTVIVCNKRIDGLRQWKMDKRTAPAS